MRHIKGLRGDWIIMLYAAFSSPLWHLVAQSDIITKVVLGILLSMSVICWSLFMYTYMMMRIKKKHMNRVFGYIHHVGTIEDLGLVADKCNGTMAGYFLTHNIRYLKSLMELQNQQGIGRLGIAYWQRVQDDIYHTIDDIIYQEEGLLWVLSTCAGASTLLGLFGTIWGLVHAFVNISEKQAADIATVAPGIAEALMTTLAGLIVAIPALIMYNYLTMQVRRIEQQLLALAQRFNRIIQVMFV